jgi:hypothetical protein
VRMRGAHVRGFGADGDAAQEKPVQPQRVLQ